jgi:hypothetical protein
MFNIEEIKLLMNITGTDKDAILKYRINIAEKFIRQYCLNDFRVDRSFCGITANFTGKIMTVTNSQNFDFSKYHFLIGDRIEILESLSNDGLYTITNINGNQITVEETFKTSTFQDVGFYVFKIQYPVELIDVVCQMITWDLNPKKNQNIKSETISRVSKTYNDNLGGYPSNITSQLNKYSGVRF